MVGSANLRVQVSARMSFDRVERTTASVDPDKQVVEGFGPGVMSAVIKPGQVSQSDAGDLVAFIKQQK